MIKEGTLTIYQKILDERQRLKKQIHQLKQKISSLPEGSLICMHDNNRIKWYHYYQKKQIYIPKRKRELAKELAIKKYLLLVLSDCQNRLQAINSYLEQIDPSISQEAENLLIQPEYQELLSQIFKPLSQELYDWMKEPYDKCPKYPELLIHKTISGNMVRSKSEAIIDMLLSTNKIPFRYECALTLDGYTIYPDFTIRHPVTGEVYYWEHFGLMDDPFYSQKAFSKMQFYASHQIIPGVHLITTFETKEHPLSIETVNKIIEQYFM